MARDARRHDARSGVAPGRGAKPRKRTTSGQASARTDPPSSGRSLTAATPPRGRTALLRGVRVTRGVVILAVVFVMLLLSYVGSVQTYLRQQHDIAVYQQQINEHNQQIADLQDKLDRWGDDDYVRAQARTRLGWVMPGETGYVVLGPDNRPIEGSSQLGTKEGLQSNTNMTWWQKLWDSLITADQPARSAQPTREITDPPPPSPTASPSK